jgi:hypothetical protein
VESGIPDPTPPELAQVTEPVLGDRTTWVTFYGQRRTARRAEYGAPSRPRAQQQIGDQSVALLHFPEHIKIEQELLLRLRNPNDLLAQAKAQEVIGRAGADFRTLFDNTRVLAKIMMLSKGVTYFDGQGNILPTSSGATFTLDYSVPANNKNQLNGLIATTWANPSTSTPWQDIEKVRILMRQTTGHELEHACYGKNIANYLYTNTNAQKFWQFNTQLYNQFQANPGAIPNGTFGIKYWHRMGDSFYDDSTGTTQGSIFGADQVTFLPTITRNVYTLFEGSILAPTAGTPVVATTLDAILAATETITGFGGYAVPEVDPVGAKIVYFDTMLPWWKQPLDLYLATVAF